MLSRFDWRSVLLARHAQHVVLIHFPIALYMMGVFFDAIAVWRRRDDFAQVAYYNFCTAAITAVPAAGTGIVAWQLALEGQRLKGILLLHLVCGTASVGMICLVWLMARSARRGGDWRANWGGRIALGITGVGLVALTGHLGGFLSGVNGGP